MGSTKENTQGNWVTILTHFGADAASLDGKHKPCPSCGGTDRFRFDDKDGSGSHICAQCGAGNGFALIQKMGGYADFKETAAAIDDVMGWSSKPLNDADKKAYKEKMERLRVLRIQGEAEAHAKAAAIAIKVCSNATVAQPDHGYLIAKGIKACGVKQHNNCLIVPVRIDGEITSVQYIKANGSKFFAKGGDVSGGCFFIVGKDAYVICEGFATGASIFEATGLNVLVAFNAGNLSNVAAKVRKKLPNANIIIAADNDRDKARNAGLEAALKAAHEVRAMISLPACEDGLKADWNDIHISSGLDVVKAGITNAVKPDILESMLNTYHTKGEQQKAGAITQPQEETVVESDCVDSDNSEYPLTPVGYSCSKHGVFVEHDDKDPERLTHRPAWVEALSRDGACDNWGLLVCWVDHDGHRHERALPAALFHANGNELAQELATSGLPIVPSKERRLLQYLAAFTPKTRLTAATSTGWHGESFVMPTRTINEQKVSASSTKRVNIVILAG